jgi:hypothetical protein
MRLFQKNVEDLSSRISAAEAMKNSWQSPSDMSEVGEMLEQLQVQPYTVLLQQKNVMVEWAVGLLCIQEVPVHHSSSSCHLMLYNLCS